MKTLLLLLLLPLIHPTAALSILLPLYLYPSTSTSSWTNVTAAIAANPKVHWLVIVNPNSGPGVASSVAPTDPNYITAIAKLNSYKNVQTLGYVDTQYAQRAYGAVTNDVAVYASWASYKGANISIAGIFFDDVNNTAGSTAVYTYMRNASAYARAKMPSSSSSSSSAGVTRVVFNPGALAPTSLFGLCDTMVEFEGAYAGYGNESTLSTIPGAYRGQSAIIVYDTPATAMANVKSLVHTMAVEKIGAVYFSADCCYNAFSLTLLMALAAAVQAG